MRTLKVVGDTSTIGGKNTEAFHPVRELRTRFVQSCSMCRVIYTKYLKQNNMKEKQSVNKHARFTPSEWKRVKKEIKGMSGGEFIRRAVLKFIEV